MISNGEFYITSTATSITRFTVDAYINVFRYYVRVCVCVCVCACVRACVRVRARACVRVCVYQSSITVISTKVKLNF